MKARQDGGVDCSSMWEAFWALALDGGPPHRRDILPAHECVDTDSVAYRAVLAVTCRGVREVSGLEAAAAEPGWIAIRCHASAIARWLAEAIVAENVAACTEERTLFVPCSEQYTLEGEVKNVISAVAKTTHSWKEHLPKEVKTSLARQIWLGEVVRRFRRSGAGR
jgi:sirohydrochlorin cobaltochelatase